MDFQKICNALTDRYPQWSDPIRLLTFQENAGVHPVDNDGRTIYYNERLLRYLTEDTQSFFVAQQLLHLQLSHHARGKGKTPALWKRASDAVVNTMLKADGFQPPENAPLLPDGEERSAEELYGVLLAQKEKEKNVSADSEAQEELRIPDKPGKKAGKETDSHTREIDEIGLEKIIAGLAEMLEPSMQLDFDWFPGSTIRDGVLSYEFRAYPVAHAEILLDTSASVDADLLRDFVRGVKGLLRQDAVVRVGCFDTRFYGFHEITTEEDIQNLELSGSGGTNFHAAVNAFTGDAENRIVFTDGFAEMPEQRCDAIWIVYGSAVIHPVGGRVLYVRPPEEKEKHEIDFLIT